MGGSLLIFLMNRITYKQILDLGVEFSKQSTRYYNKGNNSWIRL